MTAVLIEKSKFVPGGYVVSASVQNFAAAARIAQAIVDVTPEAFEPVDAPKTAGEALLVKQLDGVDAPTDPGDS